MQAPKSHCFLLPAKLHCQSSPFTFKIWPNGLNWQCWLAGNSKTRVSNGTGQRNFSGQRDSQNFFVPGQRDNGTEVPLLSRDTGTTGQAQNLAKGRDRPRQPVKIPNVTWDGMVQDFDS